MSNNKEKRLFPSFGEMLLEALEEISNIKGAIPLKIGDKVLQKEMSSVTYLIPVGSTETIGKNFQMHNKGLDKYFRKTKGIVTHIDQNFTYNCGHCSREHTHDLIVYYKEINQSFHSSTDAVMLAEEKIVEEEKK